MDLSPTFYCLSKPLLVHGSMLLLSTLILSSYSIIVVMLGWDWGLRMVINITCFKIPGSGFILFVVVVVVDSHIQRIVLATEETTATQQVSPRPIKCQSRLWSKRGTKVNGSHHGDNPLLRPTGIRIATKSYAALQAMAPTNIKTVHQTSLLHIESNLDRLGMLSPTHDQRSQQKNGKITLQPVLINKSKFLKATHFVQK